MFVGSLYKLKNHRENTLARYAQRVLFVRNELWKGRVFLV